jgi:hypothetical protein
MKAKLGVNRLTHDELADTADAVHTAMVAAAATFNAPTPSMPTLATDNAALRAAIAARLALENSLKTAVQVEAAAAEVVRNDLTLEMSYVEIKANGNATIIALAGMGVRKDATPVGSMPKVQNVKTTTSDFAGKLDWMCSPVAGVKAYIIQKCTGDPAVEANWSHADISSKSSGTLSGLTAGKIWIRVIAKGAGDNVGAPSDPAEDVVR